MSQDPLNRRLEWFWPGLGGTFVNVPRHLLGHSPPCLGHLHGPLGHSLRRSEACGIATGRSKAIPGACGIATGRSKAMPFSRVELPQDALRQCPSHVWSCRLMLLDERSNASQGFKVFSGKLEHLYRPNCLRTHKSPCGPLQTLMGWDIHECTKGHLGHSLRNLGISFACC